MMKAEKNGHDMNRLPKTGRIGRFVKMLDSDIEAEDALLILKGADQYHLFNSDEKSAWWKSAIEKLERQIGREGAISIMRKCGAKCCGKGQRNTAARLYKESGTMEDFLTRISKHDVKEGDLVYTLENENTIIAEHNRCFCQQVAYVKEPFDSPVYCHCSVEFNKQFFSSAFGKEAHVELLQSIVCGAESCKFRITF